MRSLESFPWRPFSLLLSPSMLVDISSRIEGADSLLSSLAAKALLRRCKKELRRYQGIGKGLGRSWEGVGKALGRRWESVVKVL